MSFVGYPAIDVRGGRVVRLQQGDYARETHFAENPLQIALRYAEAGAAWLHLVDLDAAKTGAYQSLELLETIVAHTSLQVQTGGGVREDADVERMLGAGAARVVVGSLAVREPLRVAEWGRRYGVERIAIALDAVQDADGEWRLPTHGWTRASGQALFERARLFEEAGLRHVLCTDIARDGMMAGPNLALYRRLHAACPGLAVQASGGLRHAADLHAARAAGCAGAIVGTALLTGQIELQEVLTC